MRRFRFFLTCLAAIVCMAAAQASDVDFVSGKDYQIHCIQWPKGCVAPLGTDSQALTYTMTPGKTSWWTITRQADGTYTVRNAAEKTYFTYDGLRTDRRRYMSLSTADQGRASRWLISVGQTGLLFNNQYATRHYLNVRTYVNIVGTYAATAEMATDNERFFLVDRRGRTVTDFEGRLINLPDDCLDLTLASAATKNRTGLRDVVSTGKASTGQTAAQGRTATVRAAFTVDGRRPVYDAECDLYLFPIPETALRGSYSARVSTTGDSRGTFSVDGAAPRATCRFAAPGAGRVYRLALVDKGDTVAVARLTFTALPIIEISGQGLSKSQFVRGAFTMHDPDGRDCDSTVSVRLRYRGDYSSLLSKKPFALKFIHPNGRKQDRRWLGMRTDNYWILDAMAIDHARMRNRVAMDLWNDMATRPYYAGSASKARTGVDGRLVEVFYNGRYHGIYNFTERIDRKQLGLAKTSGTQAHGCLYKARDWGTWSLMGIVRGTTRVVGSKPPLYDNSRAIWADWEAKYPEPSAKKQTEWQPLYDATALVSSGSDAAFRKGVDKAFDLAAVCDYYLFIELLHAVDNTGKNMIWAVYDCRRSPMLTPVPWDLDGSFGRSWDGHRHNCLATNDYRNWLLSDRIQNGLFERLRQLDVDGWRNRLVRRYTALRRTDFAPDKLYARFARYFELMRLSGADRREVRRWANRDIYLDFNGEAAYLKQWLADRIATLDRQYGYGR